MKAFTAPLALFLLSLTCACTAPAARENPMNTNDPATTHVAEGDLGLDVRFGWHPDTHALRISYTLSNHGAAPVMVFDRGDRHEVARKRLAAGAVGKPHFRREGDALTVLHQAWPLPRPTPTVPPVPLAARVAPGATLQGTIDVSAGTAARLRYCLGMRPFTTDLFSAPERGGEVELWRASFAAASGQTLLCTPWFDTRAQRFEAP